MATLFAPRRLPHPRAPSRRLPEFLHVSCCWRERRAGCAWSFFPPKCARFVFIIFFSFRLNWQHVKIFSNNNFYTSIRPSCHIVHGTRYHEDVVQLQVINSFVDTHLLLHHMDCHSNARWVWKKLKQSAGHFDDLCMSIKKWQRACYSWKCDGKKLNEASSKGS